jgi:hypothetical protein
MPPNVKGQQWLRASQNAAQIAKKAKDAERGKRKTAEKKAQKAATKAMGTQKSKGCKPDSDDDLGAEDVPDANPFHVETGRDAPAPSKPPRKRKKQHLTDDEDSDDEEAPSRLHPNDPDNFLKLCTALQLLLACSIKETDLQKADILLQEYCLELVEVRHLSFTIHLKLTMISIALWSRYHSPQSPLFHTHR